MAITVASAIARVLRIVNGIGETVALEYLQIVNDELAVELPLNLTTEDINVVAGTREYTLNVLDKRVWAAHWVATSAEGDERRLKATSISTLDHSYPDWRRRPRSRPTQRYLSLSGDSLVLGLDPKPNVTTSGGYPIVRCHVSRTSTLTANGNLPASLLSSDAHVFGAALRHAIDQQLSDRINSLKPFFDDAVLKEKLASAAVGFGDAEDPPSVTPNWLMVGGSQ